MSLNKEVEVLRDVPLFNKIDHTKLKLLAFTSENLTHQDGNFLFREGEPGDAAYIILKGKVSVFIETDKGPVEVAELKRGDVVGEISILCDVPRTASVKAIESVQKDFFSDDSSHFAKDITRIDVRSAVEVVEND